MSLGPSPVKPLLLVGALGMFIFWEELMNGLEFMSEMQESILAVAIILPIMIILLLIVLFMTEMVVIPLLFLLVLFVLQNVMIGLLTLLVVIHLLGKYYHQPAPKPCWEQPESPGGEGEGIGLGWFLLMSLFLILFTVFYDGEGYGWISLILVLGITLFFNMF
ncbi:hypothetical protein COCNU_08G005640 [Cocos nucifera]|uniref:Uncharacterized protein n=1 Tax=Cocos nucifera TaxID=13894 RepID=A0A8K0IHH1_COCNU|nr:hypothetical protein COCNU_08G005640 [Cocos nucifera]